MKKQFLILTFVCVHLSKLIAQSTTYLPNNTTVINDGFGKGMVLRSYGGAANMTTNANYGTAQNPSNILLGNELLAIQAAGSMYPDTGYYTGASINFVASENWANSNQGTDIFFKTTKNGTNILKNSMVIKNDGKIGIGTDSPKSLLHISTISNPVLPAYPNSSLILNGNTQSSLEFYTDSISNQGILMGNNEDGYEKTNILHIPADSILAFGISGSYFTIKGESGNVGIGTQINGEKLTVNGDFVLQGKIVLTGGRAYNTLDLNKKSVLSIGPSTITPVVESINGIIGGKPGKLLHIYVCQGSTLVLSHLSNNTSQENRILTPNAEDIVINNRGGCTLLYDSDASKWIVIGIAKL
ncbi:MAG: hypothetical protein ACRCVT_09065 [Leadbetterella sp.]